MFYEFASQTWTPSDPSVVVTNNTDTSIDGSSKKIAWTSAANEYVDIAFTAVNLGLWEEISLHVYLGDQLTTSDLFRITIDGNNYDFNRDEFVGSADWKHILIDCSDMGSVSGIRITSLVSNLVIMVDYIGYRKVTYNCDIDVVNALKNHIVLDYGITTTLSASAAAGSTSVSLTSLAYVNDSSYIEIDNGAGVTEQVQMITRDGTLATPLTNSFSAGNVVTILCPVLSEDLDRVEPDPVCGVKVFDMSVNREMTVELQKDTSKLKEYLGSLGLLIYIDCSSKKKVLQMARQFNRNYGEAFIFLLDGEQVEIYMDSSLFTDEVIGNNSRMAYFYRFEPQPYLYGSPQPIDTVNLTLEPTVT